MVDIPLSERLKNAEDSTLAEVLREAEVHLAAQLTSAIAADQRAYTFAGTITAASVLLIGAAYALTAAPEPNSMLAYLAVMVAVLLFVSAWLAVVSARSVEFAFGGNQPCEWIEDIESGKRLGHALAEQCAHYDEMVTKNRETMNKNGDLFNWAVNIALGGVGTGGLFFLGWMAKTLPT